MKIIITLRDITEYGGGERVITNLANAFESRGHKITILSFYKANEKITYELNKNIEVIYLSKGPQNSQNKIRKFFNKTLYKMYLSFKTIFIIRKLNPKALIANDGTFLPFIKNKNTKYIRIWHLKAPRKNRSSISLFPLLIILSSKELNTWSKYHSNIKVIPNFSSFEGNKTTNYKNKVVLSAGRLTKEKGFSRLIDIWGKIKKDKNNTWKLIILGDGEEREALESKIKQNNLDSITLEPFTSNIESKYLNASIYALSSLHEGFGMVLLEAGSYGLSLISFDINTGPSDIIEDGVNGYLIENNNLDSYASKLKELMESEDKRRIMGIKAKELIESKFNKEKIMKEWMKVLEG